MGKASSKSSGDKIISEYGKQAVALGKQIQWFV